MQIPCVYIPGPAPAVSVANSSGWPTRRSTRSLRGLRWSDWGSWSRWVSGHIKIILAGKATCRLHRTAHKNPVLGRVWSWLDTSVTIYEDDMSPFRMRLWQDSLVSIQHFCQFLWGCHSLHVRRTTRQLRHYKISRTAETANWGLLAEKKPGRQ